MLDTYPGQLSPQQSSFKITGGTEAIVQFFRAFGANENTDFMVHPSLSYRITSFLKGVPQAPVINRSFSTHIDINQVQTSVVNLNFRVPVYDELLFEIIDNNKENPSDYLIHVEYRTFSRT